MSDAAANKAILKKAIELWSTSKGGSVDHWMGIVSDDIEFRSLANGKPGLEFTTRRSNKSQLGEYLSGLSAGFEMIHYSVDHYVAEDDRVVAVGSTSWRNRSTGTVFETPKVDVVRFKNGQIIEFMEMYDTAAVLASGNGGAA